MSTAEELEGAARKRVNRAADALQATLYTRAEEIGAPPPLLEQDVGPLVLAAAGALASDSPGASDEAYRDWLIGWAPRANEAARLAAALSERVAAGACDAALVQALGPDGLAALLEGVRLDLATPETARPDLGL